MKVVYNVLGVLFLALAILGVFLPLLPTTPFLLLSASLFYKGSDRYYRWLMQHPCLGCYIENYRKHKAIPLGTKIFSVVLLWTSILIAVLFFLEICWLKILLLLIALGVSVHILSFKTLDINSSKRQKAGTYAWDKIREKTNPNNNRKRGRSR